MTELIIALKGGKKSATHHTFRNKSPTKLWLLIKQSFKMQEEVEESTTGVTWHNRDIPLHVLSTKHVIIIHKNQRSHQYQQLIWTVQRLLQAYVHTLQSTNKSRIKTAECNSPKKYTSSQLDSARLYSISELQIAKKWKQKTKKQCMHTQFCFMWFTSE